MSNPQGINQYTKGRGSATSKTSKRPTGLQQGFTQNAPLRLKAVAKKHSVTQAQVNITKGNHRPGWMLRADPKLAAAIKRHKRPR